MDMESCQMDAKKRGLKELLKKIYAMMIPGESPEAIAEEGAEKVEDVAEKAEDVEKDLNLAGDGKPEEDDDFEEMKKRFMKGSKAPMPVGAKVMSVQVKAKPKKYG